MRECDNARTETERFGQNDREQSSFAFVLGPAFFGQGQVLGLFGQVFVLVVLTVGSSDGQGWLDLCSLKGPGGQGVLSVDDDALGGFVTVVGWSGFTWSDWGVVQQLQESLTVTGNQCQFLRVLSQGVKVVVEGGLQLLSCDVGQAQLSDKGLGLGSDQLLLQDDNLWRLRVLVLQVCDAVGDLALSLSRRAYGTLDISDTLQGDSVAVVTVNEAVFQLTNFVDQDTQLVGHVGHVVVVLLTPQGQALGGNLSLGGGQFYGSHHVLLDLDQARQLSGHLWAERAGSRLSQGTGQRSLAKEPAALGRGRWWRWRLQARGRWSS